MNIWAVILFIVVSVSLLLYLMVAVFGVRVEKVFGRPFKIAIIVILFAGFSYYLFWEKSIHVEIKSGETSFHKSVIAFNEGMWEKEELFRFSSVTRGIHLIDYRQQIKDFLSGDEDKLCRNYSSQAIGTGRYKSDISIIVVCVNKKGFRWYL